MRFLISGGPTHEYLDPVRYLGNASSGTMGLLLASAARDRGHSVTLVLGPTQLVDPPGVITRRVTSALEMKWAMEEAFSAADATIMSAAVADYRPAERSPHKIKKEAEELSLTLKKNPDILLHLGRMPRPGVLVGFALEAAPQAEAVRYAEEKLARKRLDLIVCNRTGSLGGAQMEDVSLIGADGWREDLGQPSKAELAQRLIVWCEVRMAERAKRDQ